MFCSSRMLRAALGLGLGFALSCGSKGAGPSAGAPSGPGEEAPPRTVEVARAEISTWVRLLRVPAELVAFEEATLASKVPGKVAEIAVDVGTRVKQGDLVAALESRDYELEVAHAGAALEVARVRLGSAIDGGDEPFDPAATPLAAQAQVELDEARREHDRLVQLESSGVSAQAELDRAETRLARSESVLQDSLQLAQVQYALVTQRSIELEIARASLEHTRILAPFDGAVVERLVGTGEVLGTGAGVLRIVRDDPVRLRMEVSESEAAQLRIGQEVHALVAGSPNPVSGTVARTAQVIEARSRTLLVEVDLANPDGALRSGSFARAEIVVDPSAQALSVPAAALASFAGIDKVFVVEDGLAVEKRITVGRREEARVEVLGGLDEGAEVVLSPGRLRAGERVSVTR